LWLPGQKAAREAEAGSRIDEASGRRAALRLELAGELREAWWALAAARNAKALAARRLDTARELEADVRRRYTVGELSRIDANLAQSEVHAAGAELIETEANLLQAEQNLRTLTGATAPENMAEEAPTTIRTSGGALANPETHPLLIAAAAAARSARARVTVADESRRAAPELALRAVRERDDFAEPYANTIGIRLKIPFSSGAQVRRETSAAQAEANQADAEMLRTQTRVQLEAERAERVLASSERQFIMAQERRLLSAENLLLSEKAFSLGESDLATLLRIRAAAFDAEAFLDRQRVARAAAISRLNQALGVLP
jgi:cobalt-zinc-cadmium efflux system outer membrane protein